MPDPAAGTFEFPGGHLEQGETPRQAAIREWQEETGLRFPDGEFTGEWVSPNGIYQGFVYTVANESDLDIFARLPGVNPDDPDGDAIEVLAWLSPDQLADNPAVRPELAADLGPVLAALGCVPDEAGAVAKAGGAGPKAGEPVQQAWPGWNHDLQAADYWAGIIAAALLTGLSPDEIASGWLASGSVSEREAVSWLRQYTPAAEDALTDAVVGARTDGWAIGTVSAAHLGGIQADMGEWEPGASQVARELAGQFGTGDGLADMLRDAQVTIKSVARHRLEELGKVLAQGVRDGLSVDDLAAQVEGVLANPGRARMIALTELARAANTAAAWTYRLAGIREVIWVTAEDAEVCPDCDAEEARGVRPLGEGESPPLHPLCRCALIPA